MRAFTPLVIGLALVGCKKGSSSSSAGDTSPGAPSSSTDTDALWAMAPEGAMVGFVVSPRALTMADNGWQDVRAMFAKAPELAMVNTMLGAQLTKVFGKAEVTLADVGLAPGKGGAFFTLSGGGGIAVIPVADRDKWVAATKGTKGADSDKIGEATCKTISGSYICASTEDLFGKIGKGAKLKDGLSALGTRGDVEVVAAIPVGKGISAAGVMQLARGNVVMRGTVSGLSSQVGSMLKGAQIKARTDATTAGFGVIGIGPMMASAPPLPIVAGVTLADLGKSISGPVTLHIPAGVLDVDIRVPVSDPKPAATLIEHCMDLPALANAGATYSDGACHLNVPTLGYQIDLWVDGQEVRIGKKGAAKPGVAVPMTKIGEEIAKTEAAFSFWGRGTVMGQMPTPMPEMPTVPTEALMMIRGISVLNELGGAVRFASDDKLEFIYTVRTIWSNPDDVVAKIIAITPEMFFNNKAGDAAKAIAEASPGSPFAADFKAGTGGLMAPMAVAGVLAGVAVPAFMDYMKKSKKSEAALQLNKLAKHAKVYYVENATFPTGEAPTTPVQKCCEQPGGKCAPGGAAWLNEAWTKLDFQIDEPTLFQYSYKSDGKTLDAEAIGDLDCDGTSITYKLHLEADQGNPTAAITEPAPNTD
ncbi:MAG: hypothetical protein H0T46_17355 [Deltaproteobacteria bacterium]|nr:hypothetical protein [Deltaproteobacteria bacterium]